MTEERLFYHVFADNYDEYFGELPDAERHFEKLVNDGYAGVRLYEEYEFYEDGKPTGDFSDGDCLRSHGYWPL